VDLSDLAKKVDVQSDSMQGVMNKINLGQESEWRRSSDLRPKLVQKLVIDLSVARTANNPMIISQPFNGWYVESTSDANTFASMSFGSQDRYQYDNAILLKANASAFSPVGIVSANIVNIAQVGKSLTICFFVGIDYRPGSYISQITGSISVISGTTFTTGNMSSTGTAANVSVTSGAAVQLFTTNTNRSCFTLYTDQDIWVGDLNVAVNRGVKVSSGSSFKISNTSAAYAIAASATATVSGVEEQQ